MIGFSDVMVTPVSKGMVTVRARAHYDGSRGYPVLGAARALLGRTGQARASGTPVRIERGTGRGKPVTFDLHFAGSEVGAPRGFTTDGFELALALPGQPPFHRQRVDYVRQWVRDFADVRAADLDHLPFTEGPLLADTIRSAYDGDDRGAWLAVRQPDGGRVLLVVQPGRELTVLRWATFPAPGSLALPRTGGGYTVPPGGRLAAASGTVVGSEAEADLVWEPLGEADSQARPVNGSLLAPLRTPVMVPVAATRVFARGNPPVGTGRNWAEIRDLFDNCNEVAYRQNWCVDNIWGGAGIELRIVMRRDIRVPANWAQLLPYTALHEFSHEYNVPRMLNVYFFRQVEGARAWGAADRNPGGLKQEGALWVGDRCSTPDPDCWLRDVITIAHETGHFFHLVHLCDDAGPAPPCVPSDEEYLMTGGGTGPTSRRLSDVEIFQARQRAWAYRP